MSEPVIKKRKDKKKPVATNLQQEYEESGCADNYYTSECNKFQLKKELVESQVLAIHPEENSYLYPTLNDPNFNLKIAKKKEFNDSQYDGKIEDIEDQAEKLSHADFELAPHQAFVRNFLSFQTPYNSLLLYHGLGTGKTCSAIGVCEEMRDYLKQMGITKRIIIVASPNVQDNFRTQLFDERRLKEVDGIWNIKLCTGNKLLKEINPMNMKGLSKEKVVSQIKILINNYYSFLGYVEFANYIARVEEYRGEYKDAKDLLTKKAHKLQREFNDRLIVIDEVHNIRMDDNNENKRVATELMKLVRNVDNLRLLLLSATPMYNSYKEIVWLLNLMNINDKRATIEVSDIFDSSGEFKTEVVDGQTKEVGKELLIRKATGYVSFVRGDNPYTFPFRVFPNVFANTALTTFTEDKAYPKYQMNGKKIPKDDVLKILSLFLTEIGSVQSLGYQYIIDSLRKKTMTITTRQGQVRKMPSFDNMDKFGYTMLQLPLEALNMVYPMEGLDRAVVTPVSSYSEGEDSVDSVGSVGSADEEEEKAVTRKQGEESDEEADELSVNPSGINPQELTGKHGLARMMDYIQTTTPAVRGEFKYKKSTVEKYGRIFSPPEIGKYSSKIKNICKSIVSDEGVVSKGIILIYSQYIEAGLFPMALALEEMGFSRYGDNAKSLFKTPPSEPMAIDISDEKRYLFKPRPKKLTASKTLVPARYVMITGDSRISPNNNFEVKALTSEDNMLGNKIKVVLISKAGSEGLDFKFIRQVHIMEPWYNMNRNEQIIGRAVRNFSHKDLPFKERNVQIYLYGTMLERNVEESADLYVYRVAEKKAVQIGKVSRVLKQTAVDCIINRTQTNFTVENFADQHVTQILSDGQTIKDFPVGDTPKSSACDYMDTCDYKCVKSENANITDVNTKIDEKDVNLDTYNETYIMMNSEKIMQKIKLLMKERFFYIKKELLLKINDPKPFPKVQIYAALTQLIEDHNEYLIDKYGRTGYLINIGEYYLFQPSELNYEHTSIFDRSVPIDYKHSAIKFDIKLEDSTRKAVLDTRAKHEPGTAVAAEHIGNNHHMSADAIMKTMLANYKMATEYLDMDKDILKQKMGKNNEGKNTDIITDKGEHEWYKFCAVALIKLHQREKFTIPILKECLVEHLVDMLIYLDKVAVLNYLYSKEYVVKKDSLDEQVKHYFDKQKKHLTGDKMAIILFNGNNKLTNEKILVYDNTRGEWVPAEYTDKTEFDKLLSPLKVALSDVYGFIEYANKNKYLVFKTKDKRKERELGARCDEAGKVKVIKILNDIITNKFTKDNTKNIIQPELCCITEFVFRYYTKTKREGKTWFFSPETAILYLKKDKDKDKKKK